MISINVTKQLQLGQGYTQLQVNTTIQANAVTAVYGPSGAGKTTLLKILAGLVQPEEGTITINGATWLNTAARICLPPQQRNIGFVFQDYALFPHMTVLQNLQYAAGKNSSQQYINELLQLIKMETFINARPSQLSGGQQQRIALIRALVRKPQLLLLDEPLGALDSAMRQVLRTELHTLLQQLQITTLLVSHDISEVYTLAAHIIQLANGRIVYQGTPKKLFGAVGLSSKMQLTGEVLQIQWNGAGYDLEILTGSEVIYVGANAIEACNLQQGDKVLLIAKATDISIKKINE